MADEAKHAYFIDSGGKVVPVGLDKVSEAQQMGWTPASEKQVDDHILQEKYGTGTQQLKTGAEAVGQALTLGLSTHAEKALGVSPEDIKGREEANPGVHGIGTAVGIAAPLIASAGAAAPLEAAEGAGGALNAARTAAEFSAPSLVARAGKAVSGAAEGLLPGVAGDALSAGAGAATEGALYGAGQVVHEQALGDPNLTAQSALSEIGLSAALGGGLGALTGVAESAIPALAKKTKDAVSGAFGKGEDVLKSVYGSAEGITGTAGDTATFMLEHRNEIAGLSQSIPGVAEDISHATPEMAQWITQNGTRLSEMEQAFPGTTGSLSRVNPETADYLLNNWQKVMTDPQQRIEVATGLRKGMQEVLDSTNGLLRKVNTELASSEEEALLGSEASGNFPRAAPEKVQQASSELFEKINGAVEKMRAEPELHSGAMARQLELVRDGLARETGEAAGEAISPLDTFRRLKTLRRQLDEAIPWNASMMGVSEKNSVNILKGLRSDVKSLLTNSEVFGEQAARKAGLDEAQSEWLKLTGKKGPFRKLFLDSEGKIPSTKVDTWLNAMAKDKGVESGEAWGRLMDAAKKVADEAEKSHAAAPVGNFDREALRSLHEKSAQMVADARQAGEATAKMKYLQSGGMGIPNSGPFVPDSGLAVKVMHHIPGASLIHGAYKTVTSVPKTVAVLTALEKAGQKTAKAIDSGISAMLKGASSRATSGLSTGTGADYFAKHSEKISQLANNPQHLQDALTQQSDSLHSHAPDTAQAMQVSSARAVSFLASKLPQVPTLGPLGPKLKPGGQEMWKFNRYHAAVEAPTNILKHAAAGTLTPMDVEAVKTVYPELYQKMTTSLLEGVTNHKGAVPYKARLGMSLMLGTSVDGTATPEALQANQIIYRLPSAKSAENQTGPGAMGSTSQTGLSKLTLGNRASLPGQAADSRRRSGG